MPSRRKTKRLLKAEERFKSAVTNFIVSLGARPGRFYDYEIDTPAGPLYLSVYDNWVSIHRYCRSWRLVLVTCYTLLSWVTPSRQSSRAGQIQ
jgi:hypothetical protein